MNLLLDTHVLLWMFGEPERLSNRAADALTDERNGLFFSVVGWWELAIKVSLNKLTLLPNWAPSIKREMRRNGIEWLSLLPDHAECVAGLPFHHRDPFDRMLIAQAVTSELSVVTADAFFSRYGLDVVW